MQHARQALHGMLGERSRAWAAVWQPRPTKLCATTEPLVHTVWERFRNWTSSLDFHVDFSIRTERPALLVRRPCAPGYCGQWYSRSSCAEAAPNTARNCRSDRLRAHCTLGAAVVADERRNGQRRDSACGGNPEAQGHRRAAGARVMDEPDWLLQRRACSCVCCPLRIASSLPPSACTHPHVPPASRPSQLKRAGTTNRIRVPLGN